MNRVSVFIAAALFTAAPKDLVAQRAENFSQTVRDFVTADQPVIALTRVTVVDGTGAAPAQNQVVIIRDGRIAAVGPATSTPIPPGARILELAGHTVIPGLIGLHNHTFYTTSGRSIQLSYSSPRLYLGTGITTIRTTGAASPYSELNMKRGIEQGEIPGPRMHVTGPYITGSASAGTHMVDVGTAEEARRVVAYWAEEGATWFKAYTGITREALGAAIQEAHRRGLKFTGHLCSVSFREAVALGIDNLEHGLFTNSDYDPTKQLDRCPGGMRNRLAELDMASPDVATTIREMVQNQVAMTSTLAVYELSLPGRPPLEPRFEKAMAPEAYREYMATRESIQRGNSAPVVALFGKAQQFEVAFARAGGLLGAGVDPTGNGGALPGFGDQRNYELLIEAGFTPVEAIRIMSLNGAKILGNERDLGSVEVGKLADLVVIRGDPVARPGDIRNVVTVFKDGIGYDAVKLIDAVNGVVGVR